MPFRMLPGERRDLVTPEGPLPTFVTAQSMPTEEEFRSAMEYSSGTALSHLDMYTITYKLLAFECSCIGCWYMFGSYKKLVHFCHPVICDKGICA